MNPCNIFGLLAGVYLIGAIPIGFLVAKFAGVTDIRNHGSGNIGATNVARVLGTQFFPLIFLVDVAKSFLPVMWCVSAGRSLTAVCIVAASLFLGNICSIFLNGSGGKGVATSIGILAVLAPVSLVPVVGVWLAALTFTRTVGIASAIAVGTLPGVMWYLAVPLPVQLLGIFLAVGILFKHVDNVRRYFTTAAL